MNWDYELIHAEYLFRGWRAGWAYSVAGFTGAEWMLLGTCALVFLWSGWSIYRSAK
jgi:hypothetical protein